jgi:predicted phosphodiesterase
MMRIQIMSDLHLGPHAAPIPPLVDGVSLVVVAGDTREGLVESVEILRAAHPEPVQIAMVAGNHEFYGRHYHAELAAGLERARSLGVHLLENATAHFGRLRTIGATFWTDYLLFGPDLRAAAMRAAQDTMRDHKRIKWQKQPEWLRFRPQEALALHMRSRAYFEEELSRPHDGPTMLIAHHGLTLEAVAPAFERSLTAAAYTSQIPFVDGFRPDYVISGHTHHRIDFRRHGVRFISNPRGYPDERGVRFDPRFVLEVPDA